MTVHAYSVSFHSPCIAGEAYFVCTAYETVVNMHVAGKPASGLWLGHGVITIAFQGVYAQSPDPMHSHQTLPPLFRPKGVAYETTYIVTNVDSLGSLGC